jgi:hypothetical protein
MSDTQSSASAAPAESPKPMPFAIMRNAHEAFRASILLQEQKLDAGDDAGFREEWQTFQRAIVIHMAMEDDAVFALLDEVGGGAITAAKLPAEHLEDAHLARAVNDVLDSGDVVALRAAWTVWKDDHLNHLKHEEDVMMPLTMKTGPTPEARARTIHNRVLVPSEALPGFDWYVGWVVYMLSRYGSAGHPAAVATRGFAWGLQHACSPAQWNRLRPVVERNTTPEIWAELTTKFGLGGAGTIV